MQADHHLFTPAVPQSLGASSPGDGARTLDSAQILPGAEVNFSSDTMDSSCSYVKSFVQRSTMIIMRLDCNLQS